MNLLDFKPVVESVTIGDATVYLREFSGSDRAALQKLANDYEKAGKPTAELVTHIVLLTVCDEAGKRLYTLKDFDAVNALPSNILDKIALASRKLNGLEDDAVDEAKKN